MCNFTGYVHTEWLLLLLGFPTSPTGSILRTACESLSFIRDIICPVPLSCFSHSQPKNAARFPNTWNEPRPQRDIVTCTQNERTRTLKPHNGRKCGTSSEGNIKQSKQPFMVVLGHGQPRPLQLLLVTPVSRGIH